MCRWLAYTGPSIHLDTLLFIPENSLINQSQVARKGATPTNGDGFGIGWYDRRPEPGLFRDILPAWNDENLRNVAEQIAAPLFFAHVRASTGTSTSRANCHPFRHGHWLFMHNGQIGGFEHIRRQLVMAISPELYPWLTGTTDSEVFFYLALTNGLEEDPPAALSRTVALVQDATQRAGIEAPFRMTSATSDGRRLYALRYASDGPGPSLFYGCGVCLQATGGETLRQPKHSTLVLSEPLDFVKEQWNAVAPSQLLTIADGKVALNDFVPRL